MCIPNKRKSNRSTRQERIAVVLRMSQLVELRPFFSIPESLYIRDDDEIRDRNILVDFLLGEISSLEKELQNVTRNAEQELSALREENARLRAEIVRLTKENEEKNK